MYAQVTISYNQPVINDLITKYGMSRDTDILATEHQTQLIELHRNFNKCYGFNQETTDIFLDYIEKSINHEQRISHYEFIKSCLSAWITAVMFNMRIAAILCGVIKIDDKLLLVIAVDSNDAIKLRDCF